ncbi:hypothetical protein EB796_012963 [Bugula neritina]|uniref:EF-hand domain-containing protein n=1 Tax=Bugula neritina TaxID=10212 RepID=A0A7J7JSV8_BUGNE|nr:hypothetical protein EB796_012963 [Bugula neritina]
MGVTWSFLQLYGGIPLPSLACYSERFQEAAKVLIGYIHTSKAKYIISVAFLHLLKTNVVIYMALSPRSNEIIKKRSRDKLVTSRDPIERLRLKCQERGGAGGIRGLSRTFRIFDDDGNKMLNFDEFSTGLNDYGLFDISIDEKRAIFAAFDKDKSGQISFNEFLERIRPPMSQRRLGLVAAAFSKLDITGDGKITVEDLAGVYNARKHPKYMNGEWTEKQVKLEFLKNFDAGNKDGTVEKHEFFSYYAGVSASIDQDPYFDLMMRNSYNLSD